MPTPRPHYKERIAHAEGYEIEIECDDGMGYPTWRVVNEPAWDEHRRYRVKSEPKLDVVRLTFDGETGQLKSAEVIQQS